MSGEALYERYKDALKRGHVASLRGRLEEALTAYAEAAAIAPERATPHTSAGTALMRRRRAADALRHYTVALTLAPNDEAALLGRAQALTALDRRPDAADAFDALADRRASAGKLADAVDAARRGLELAEGRDRRRTLERLIERLRATEPDAPGRAALEQALRVLEGVAVPTTPSTASAEAPAATTGVAAPTAGAEGADVPAEAPAPVRAALDRDVADDVDPAELARVAEDVAGGVVAPGVLDRLLDLATVHRRAGHVDAALDACYLGLSVEPDDIGLHLALVELYDERGWSALAAEKLDLLERLASLDADEPAKERLTVTRAARR